MVRSERSSRRGLTLFLTLALCGVLSALHRQSERVRGNDPLTSAVSDAALVPNQGLAVRISRWWDSQIVSIFHGPALARENAALRAKVSALTFQNQRLASARVENARLRYLLHFQMKSDRAPLAAEVLALKPSPQIDSMTLSKGMHDSVKPQTVVLGPSGAVAGQVLEASVFSCTVLLLTDPNSSVGAQASRGGRPGPVGICQGDHSGTLDLTDLGREADVRPGDTVTTSGLGGVFPKGCRIGTVLSVTFDKRRSLKTARVRAAVDFDHLEDVFLLTEPAASDLSANSAP